MSTPLRCLRQARDRGFTLVELLIVVAVLAVILTLAAPSLREMIEMQRLRGTSAQLTTDIQFARSEAVSRQEVVQITFDAGAAGMSCYIVHTCAGPADGPGSCSCECSAPSGSRCGGDRREIRTVQLPAADGVRVAPVPSQQFAMAPNRARFDPRTGAMAAYYVGVGGGATLDPEILWAETALTRPSNPPKLRTMVSLAGRPSVCSPGGRVGGVPAC
jgi:prepilin-type N-terminal cleavage/methylation domain-containing protein